LDSLTITIKDAHRRPLGCINLQNDFFALAGEPSGSISAVV